MSKSFINVSRLTPEAQNVRKAWLAKNRKLRKKQQQEELRSLRSASKLLPVWRSLQENKKLKNRLKLQRWRSRNPDKVSAQQLRYSRRQTDIVQVQSSIMLRDSISKLVTIFNSNYGQ